MFETNASIFGSSFYKIRYVMTAETVLTQQRTFVKATKDFDSLQRQHVV